MNASSDLPALETAAGIESGNEIKVRLRAPQDTGPCGRRMLRSMDFLPRRLAGRVRQVIAED